MKNYQSLLKTYRARKEDIPLTTNTYENKTVTPTLRLTAVVFSSIFWLERKITLD